MNMTVKTTYYANEAGTTILVKSGGEPDILVSDDDSRFPEFSVGALPFHPPEMYLPPTQDPLTLPIEPAPFWNAVFDLFGMKDTDVLDAIEDPDQRYLAANSIARRKTYQRDNETFIQLAALKGYTDPAEVDTLWRYIQANYS